MKTTTRVSMVKPKIRKVGTYEPHIQKKDFDICLLENPAVKEGEVFWVVCIAPRTYLDVRTQAEAEMICRLIKIMGVCDSITRQLSTKSVKKEKVVKDSFKKWTKKEFDKFVDDNFMEETDKIWALIKDCSKVNLEMTDGGVDRFGDNIGVLVIKIRQEDSL